MVPERRARIRDQTLARARVFRRRRGRVRRARGVRRGGYHDARRLRAFDVALVETARAGADGDRARRGEDARGSSGYVFVRGARLDVPGVRRGGGGADARERAGERAVRDTGRRRALRLRGSAGEVARSHRTRFAKGAMAITYDWRAVTSLRGRVVRIYRVLKATSVLTPPSRARCCCRSASSRPSPSPSRWRRSRRPRSPRRGRRRRATLSREIPSRSNP
mmetsp:Transcript_4200/g.14771  ORF Transcript_4200/g.14771 Transcript_4200/m.14771 type:complete len:221 (-) Transcript_4200:2491-3153(-)